MRLRRAICWVICWVLAVGPSACTAVGHKYGTRIDELQMLPVEPEKLDEFVNGRLIVVRTLNGESKTGRLLLLERDPGGGRFVIQQEGQVDLLGRSKTVSDTVLVTDVESVLMGNEAGTAAFVGSVSGLALDIFLVWWIASRIINGLGAIGE